jgi:hypothetical protein
MFSRVAGCKPFVGEARDHLAIEPMRAHKHIFRGAMGIAGEQF